MLIPRFVLIPPFRCVRSRQDIGCVGRCERLHPETGLPAGEGLVLVLRGCGDDGDPRECWDIPQDPLTKLGKEQQTWRRVRFPVTGPR